MVALGGSSGSVTVHWIAWTDPPVHRDAAVGCATATLGGLFEVWKSHTKGDASVFPGFEESLAVVETVARYCVSAARGSVGRTVSVFAVQPMTDSGTNVAHPGRTQMEVTPTAEGWFIASLNVMLSHVAGLTPVAPGVGVTPLMEGRVESTTGTWRLSVPFAPSGSATSARTVMSVASTRGTFQL